MSKNTGYIFYKGLYKGLDNDIYLKGLEKKHEKQFQKNNRDLFSSNAVPVYSSFLTEKLEKFTLKSIYPGILIGSGYSHGVNVEDRKVKVHDFKTGFYFDYTSGMPVIPGSSIKGTIKSAFERDSCRYIAYLLKNNPELAVLKGNMSIEETTLQDLSSILQNLKTVIFEGTELINKNNKNQKKPMPIYDRDIFYDAEINTEYTRGSVIGDDYITKHYPDLLKNPIPIRFLKILPDVYIDFYFDLKMTETKHLKIELSQKMQLFKLILLDIGIGARTNVGYGKLTE